MIATGLGGCEWNAQRLSFLNGVVAGCYHGWGQYRGRRGRTGRYHQLQVAPRGAQQHLIPVDGAVFRYIDCYDVEAVGHAPVFGNAGGGVDEGKIASTSTKRGRAAESRVIRHRLGQGRKGVAGSGTIRCTERVHQPVPIGVNGVVEGDGRIVLANDGYRRVGKYRRAVKNQRRGHAHI